MDIDIAVDIILKLTGAMIKVHARDVLHRDISPSNVIITEDTGIKLIDFGSARQFALNQANSMSVILKNGFAPIEQYSRKGNHGPWTDIYSICATFYYMIAGKLPEQATDRVIEDNLVPPTKHGADITSKQEAVLLKGLAVKATERYQSASELKSAIEEAYMKHRVIVFPVPFSEQNTVALEEKSEPALFITSEYEIPIDQILNLTAIIYPLETKDNKLIWTSDNTGIATVTGGKVTAISAGKTIITAKTSNGKTVACSVTVKAIEVSAVKIKQSTININTGETAILSVTVLPDNASDKTLILKSSDTNIATVNGLSVTTKNTGKVTITATSSNGITDTCVVTSIAPVKNTQIIASDKCGDNTSWRYYSDHILIINGYGKMNNYDHDNIVPWKDYNQLIESVIVDNGVINIGAGAFYYCGSLTDLKLQNSVIDIGYTAFEGCYSLNHITIPDSVTNIGIYAFQGWKNKQTIYIKGRSYTPTSWNSHWNYDCNAINKWNQ